MASGENSIADSMTKMAGVMNDRLLRESARMSSANWERSQRLAYGEHYRETDGVSDEMILVDSTITINQTTPEATSPASQCQQLRHDPASESKATTSPGRAAGTFAKLALGAALTASGAGAGIGIPLLMSGGKDVVEKVTEKPAGDIHAPTAGGTQYILELGK